MSTGSKLKAALAEKSGPSKARIKLTSGMAVRLAREAQGMSQGVLAEKSGIPQSAISAIERDAISLGVERAKMLARALKVHPAVLAFPSWDEDERKAAG